MSLSNKAEIFAREKHASMKRPNKAQQPIVEHLAEVASLVRGAGGNEYAIAAAWLHDVVEDTSTTLDEISILFGDEISKFVDGLTDPPDFSGKPLSQRKPMQAERLINKSVEIKLIKLCDQISNVYSVLVDPPLDWTSEKSLAYVMGAKTIADVCRGINSDLDEKFDNYYAQAIKKYKISEGE